MKTLKDLEADSARRREQMMAQSLAQTRSELIQQQREWEARRKQSRPPKGWKRPPYGTPEFMKAYAWGWISDEEAEKALERSERASRNKPYSGKPSPRWNNDEPYESRQYAGYMATTAARDDRLTPQAKALLQLLRARVGNGKKTYTTKETLARCMSRSKRSIQRYIRELVKFDYIFTQIRINGRGLHIGLIISLKQKVFPFWKDDTGLANWLARTEELPSPFDWTNTEDRKHKPDLFDFIGETDMSSKNYNPNLNIIIGQWAPLLASLYVNKSKF